MGTVILFAELYREEPLVRGTSLPKFVLLFEAFDDNIRLRETWDPQQDPAHFALLVQQVVSQEGTTWVVRVHPESPRGCLKRLNHGCKLKHVRACDAPVAILSPQEELRFTFSKIILVREIRMVLFKIEEDVSPPESGSIFGRLPNEMKLKIFSHLPWTDVAFTIPSVSKSLFDAVKRGTIQFPTVDFRKESLTLDDFGAMVNISRENMIALMHMLSLTERNFEDDRVLLAPSLPIVNKSVQERRAAKIVDRCLRSFGRSLQPLRFSNLTVLKLDVHAVPLSRGIFDGCVLAVLEELDVQLSSNMDFSKWWTFKASFPGLKRLAMDVALLSRQVEHVFPRLAWALESMPKLEMLTLHNLGKFTVLSIEDSLHYGVPATVVSLSGIWRKDENFCRRSIGAHVQALLSCPLDDPHDRPDVVGCPTVRLPALKRLSVPERRLQMFFVNVPEGITNSDVERLEISCLRSINKAALRWVGWLLKLFPNVSCLMLDTEFLDFHAHEFEHCVSSMGSRLVHVEMNLRKKPIGLTEEEWNVDLLALEREMNRHLFFVLRRGYDSSRKAHPRHVEHEDCFMKPLFLHE